MNPQNNWKREELPQEVAAKVARFCESNAAHPYNVEPVKLDNGLNGWRLHYAKNYLTKKPITGLLLHHFRMMVCCATERQIHTVFGV